MQLAIGSKGQKAVKILAAGALAAAVGIIAACGDGGSSSSDTATVSGTVADGYLRNAEVFLDMNGNYQWDEGEPKAMSGAGGHYSFQVSSGDAGQYPVVCRVIAGTTVDEDNLNTPVTGSYVMSAPAGTTAFISPMSTLLREKLEADPTMTMEQAMTQLRNQLNLAAGPNMLADYIAGTDAAYDTIHEVARQMATLMAQQSSLVMNGTTGAVYRERYRAMMGQLNLEMPYITDNVVSAPTDVVRPMDTIRQEMMTYLGQVSTTGTFTNYTAMFRNMTSQQHFWNYSGSRMRPGSMMGWR
jgi:hypothetical protein